ncbi:hypothetical protein [Catellatospora sp. NPDC049609]|uniref:hypothetical protein n=1 Tax=Catellatospora sp. NPDC049609 TaxID=3155505 RepID=UPI00343D5EDB
MTEDRDDLARVPLPVRQRERLHRRRRATAAFVWLVLPMLVLAMTLEGAQQLRPSWRAHRGVGTPGVFTTTRCVKADCFSGGVWTSDDGSRTLRGVRLHDAPAGPHQVGDRIRALDTGLPHGVYVAGGSAYLSATVELAAGVLGLLVLLALLASRLRRPRRERS